MLGLQKIIDWDHVSSINDWQTFCDDFDGNGTNELFAVVSSNVNEEAYEGRMRAYLVDASGARLLEEVENGSFCFAPTIDKVPLYNRTITVMGFSTSYGGPGCEPFYWIYDHGRATRLENCPGGLVHGSGRDFTCGTSSISLTLDDEDGFLTGRAWYDYYYYIDDKGELKEYGGKPMTGQWLRSKKGSDQAFSEIQKRGGKITSIFYRKNGIFNVNFSVRGDGSTDFYYIKGKIDNDDTLHYFLEDESIVFGGTYEAALTPDIATY